MEEDEMLLILKSDLELSTSGRDDYLRFLLSSAARMIQREGITLRPVVEDSHLQIMYAAYLYRKRAEGAPMPRMLRWALNNRLLGEKGGRTHAT